ncbi:MAG: hypothetical protein COB40_06400 [Marinosulfonomonas sp.]|nr:MAG: hypothetical protein COB40_06400 [Marinosulfonomonas sp.]
MREIWARRIAFLTGLAVLLLTVVFAMLQNPDDLTESAGQIVPIEQVAALTLDAQSVAAGWEIYERENCARCHSIDGQGSPRTPLDGVGTRHDAEAMIDWIVGAEKLQGMLSDRTWQQKQSYKELSAEDLRVLSIYMQSLRPENE